MTSDPGEFRTENAEFVRAYFEKLESTVGLPPREDPAGLEEWKRRLHEHGQLETVHAVLRRVTLYPDGRIRFDGLIPKPRGKTPSIHRRPASREVTHIWNTPS